MGDDIVIVIIKHTTFMSVWLNSIVILQKTNTLHNSMACGVDNSPSFNVSYQHHAIYFETRKERIL